MSGFVEKIFDSFANKHGQDNQQQQQQQPYGGYQQGQQQLPHPWISRWDEREQRYIYINEMTGERSWTPPQPGGQSQGYGGGGGYGSGYSQQPYGDEGQREGHHGGGGGGSNAAAWGIGGAALGLGAGALLMHEGEEMSEFLCFFPLPSFSCLSAY